MDRLRPLQWIGAVAAALLAVLLVSTAALAESAETGVLVRSVAADSPAAEAGIVRGDIILAFDGEALEDAAALVERMAEAEPGDTLALTVRHGDEEFTAEVTLGESDGRAYLGILPDYGVGAGRWDEGWGRWHKGWDEGWGRSNEEWDRPWSHPHLFGMMPFTGTASGALVSQVVEDSPAEEAGLVAGDVILGADGEKLAAAADLAERVAAHAPGDEIVLEVLRADGGEIEDVPVTLAANPDDEAKAYLGVRYLPTPRRMFLGRTDDGGRVVPTPPYHDFGRRSYRHPSWRMPAPQGDPQPRFGPPRGW